MDKFNPCAPMGGKLCAVSPSNITLFFAKVFAIDELSCQDCTDP